MPKNASHPSSYFDGDVFTSLQSIDQTLSSGIFSSDGARSPFFRPCVTQVLIDLNDVLQKADKAERRISFSDDVDQTARHRDVTDLIRDCRNAACHVSSGNHIFEQNKFVFNVVVGKGSLFQINDIILGSDYEDDICVMWGSLRLYLRRHVLRAFQEVRQLYPSPWDRRPDRS